jgi:hypothetical protein
VLVGVLSLRHAVGGVGRTRFPRMIITVLTQLDHWSVAVSAYSFLPITCSPRVAVRDPMMRTLPGRDLAGRDLLVTWRGYLFRARCGVCVTGW